MVITAEEVRIIDSNCVELGMSVLQLMENAGAAATKITVESFPKARTVALCCGTGNNGGDGFVVARHLTHLNKKVKLLLVGQETKIHSKVATQNFRILKEMEQTIEISTINDSSKISFLKKELVEVDLIVDALLGIGITSEPYEPIKSAIKTINNSGKSIISIDIPSGMWSDLAKKPKLMIKADKIVTFHDTKPCLTIEELKEKTVIVGIGVPPEAEFFAGKGDLKYAIPRRKSDSHKGQNGTVLVVGGSLKYSGAPVLASKAALRTGADLVITCIPKSISNAVRSDSPNMIVQSFDGDYFTPESIPEILELFKKFDSMVLGPGISENKKSLEFVEILLLKIPKNKPIIVDADALKIMKSNLKDLQEKKLIITPHSGEFKIIFDKAPNEDWSERAKFVTNTAKENKTTILLKGKYDIISDGEKTKINRTGHVGMTVGGTGDVLAGILGAICAVNENLFRSSCAASYLAGKAGELAAEDFGNSLLATDVIEKIPEILLQL